MFFNASLVNRNQ